MACSKYEYVKKFEEARNALPQTYIMVRIDVSIPIPRAAASPNSAQHTDSPSPTISEQST